MKVLFLLAALVVAPAFAAEPKCTTANGCFSEGLEFESSPKLELRRQAAAAYEKSCALKELRGCANAAAMHADGDLGAKNAKRAAELRSQACEGGLGGPCNDLGIQYEDGVGVARDLAKSMSLYQRACEHRDYGGCHNLGLLKENPAAPDLFGAADAYGKGCSLNMRSPSCREIRRVIATLGPTERKTHGARVAALLKLACETGDAQACP